MNVPDKLEDAVADAYGVPALEYALAAILDCHTRILAAHPPSPKRQAKRAAWRKNAAAFAARHRAERRGK